MSEVTFEMKKVVTGKFRVSYPHIDKPQKMKGSETAKYSVQMLFDKDEDLSKMKTAILNAKIEAFGENKDKWPTKRLKSGKIVSALKSPFRDGDRERPDDPEYRGKIFIAASAKEGKKPGIVDKNRDAILDTSEFYAGCYARAELVAFVYEFAGKRGCSFALLNLQKLGDGPRLGGKKDAKDVFDAVEDDSDQAENYESEEEEDDLGF